MLGKKVPYIAEDSFVSRCLTAQPGARFILVACMEGGVDVRGSKVTSTTNTFQAQPTRVVDFEIKLKKIMRNWWEETAAH